MKHKKLDDILNVIFGFAKSNNQILAVALCGSWARGTSKPDSDIDLFILVKDKLKFKETNWIENFEFEKINDKLDYFKDEVYGQVWSRHVFLESNIEIEFSFANKSWANIKNLDNGTRKVVSDGFRVIYDPEQIFQKLIDKVISS